MTRITTPALLTVTLLSCSAPIAFAQGHGAADHAHPAPGHPATTLGVTGDVQTPLSLSAAEIKALPRTKVTVSEGGRTVVYDGVQVSELMKRAGVPVGEGIRGKALTSYVLARGTDGYEVLLSLVELDAVLGSSRIIVADSADAQPLAEKDGAFRLIVPNDSHPSRSVRNLERLEVVQLRK
jgi:DMSO/TMAO reductase YedYZ molybdopterin-dependent catalytic subunit